MRKLLDEKLDRFIELEQQLVNPEVLSNSARMAVEDVFIIVLPLSGPRRSGDLEECLYRDAAYYD